MKSLLNLTIVLFLISNHSAAEEAPLSEAFSLIKESNNAKVSLAIAGAYVGNLKLRYWGLELKRQGIQRERLSYENMRYVGNAMYLPGFEEPIVVSSDRKRLQFKGVSFEIQADQSLTENLVRMKKAWGEFSEFTGVKPSAWSFLMPPAQAGLVDYCHEHPFDCTLTALGSALIVIPIAGEVTEPILLARLANAERAAAAVNATKVDATAIKVTDMTEAEMDQAIARMKELNARPGPEPLNMKTKLVKTGVATIAAPRVGSEVQKITDWNFPYHFSRLTCEENGDVSLTNTVNESNDRLSDVPEAKRAHVKTALKEICKEGPQRVAEFNSKLGVIKVLTIDEHIENPKPVVEMKEKIEPETPMAKPKKKRKEIKLEPVPLEDADSNGSATR